MERANGRRALYWRAPKPLRVALTFLIVVFSWVFFRSETLADAGRYLGSMFGLGSAQVGADLLGGIMYKPYYVGVFALAALVVWRAPQTWDFSRSITPVKAAVTVTVMWFSLALLFTQSFNPFIYFIF